MKLLPSRGCISAKCTFSRSGSALLVVLGMLSFMIISGLAFSIYMRTTRLSSSFTRRTVTTRQLAKAALAEAIDQIDRAVANDPHPGVRNPYRSYLATLQTGKSSSGSSSSKNSGTDEFDSRKIDNVWSHRVLVGQVGSLNNLQSGVEVKIGQTTYYPEFVEPEETASVLALEALAYLPPSLVNEARYYGQRTPTANWQSLDFDAGRYAYIAVDVSDFFDVNRFCAKLARSSDPMARVTLGHLFETDMNHENSGSNVADWENFMGQYRTIGTDGRLTFTSQMPFVSLADFQLALGTRTKAGGLQSPFFEYFNQKSSSGVGFYVCNESSDEYERYSLMNFVTDSLLAPYPEREQKTEEGEKVLNLADDNNQIFRQSFLESAQENRTLRNIGSMKNQPFSRLVQKRIPYVTMFALNDYLDCDRIPITLGMPSVERVPMICGIQPSLNGNGSFAVKADYQRTPDVTSQTTPAGTWPATRTVTRNVSWSVDAASLAKTFQAALLRALVVYPFRNHEQANESSWFKLDGKIQLFLSTDEMHLRTGNSKDLLHWTASGSAKDGGTAGLQDKAVINLPLRAQAINLTTVPFDNQKVDQLGNQFVQEVRFDLKEFKSDIESCLQKPKGDLVTLTYTWTETQQTQNDAWKTSSGEAHDSITVPEVSYCSALTPVANSDNLYPLKVDGMTKDTDFASVTLQSAATFQKDLRLNMAVTLRVISDEADVRGAGSSGTKTVDMVPATLFDDELNGINNGNGIAGVAYRDLCGTPTPLMKFETGVALPFKFDSAQRDSPIAVTPQAVMVNDPRYNHAPENWVEMNNFSAQGWYDVARASAEANDGDIFMASSDQGYLQSVYEFAFLPRMTDLVKYDNWLRGNLAAYPSKAEDSWVKLAPNGADITKALDAGVMWRTYDIFGRYGADGDDFDGLGLEYEGNGLRVNPYSNFSSVLMSAFANTPHDWRVASNNEDENPAGSSAMDNAATFNQKHAWNDYSSGASLCWEMLEDVAAQFRDRVRDGFSPKNNLIYAEDENYCIQNLNDEYTPIWQDAFAKFFGTAAGNGAERTLCNVQLDDDCSSVYSVDKKFLYGYWKSCFAARQQLYLVFFRAEPMMLGGGIAGVTPPQLGAKGVAVVWRDPYDPNERKSAGAGGTVTRYYPTADGNDQYVPHKTRVLFYKQFE